MTKDKARKREARKRAEQYGIPYVMALRELNAERTAPEATEQPPADVIKTALARREFTGESYESALAGAGRNGDFGFDSCTTEQRSFRALFALGLFNKGPITPAGMDWGYSVLSAYDPVVSPRQNELAVIAERAPDNVTDWVLPTRSGMRLDGVPGLRLESRDETDQRTYTMRHLPTGARLVVTSRPTGKSASCSLEFNPWRGHMTLDDDLTPAEERALGLVPHMSDDAETLLAGLVSRYTLEDPKREWATSWDWDPLERPGDRRTAHRRLHGADTQRRLWGEGNSWELQWTGYPFPKDLAIALTNPDTGINGARFSQHRNIYEVTLGDALLEIREWRA